MALKITPPFVEAGVEFDHLHLRQSTNSAPENDESPFSLNARFRVYKDNEGQKLFAPLDKIGLLSIDIVDVEKKAQELAMQGNLEESQTIATALKEYEKALAIFIMAKHPELTVEVI